MYTLHRVIHPSNGPDRELHTLAFRTPDGEAHALFDEDNCYQLYLCLDAFYRNQIIHPQPVEVEELQSYWRTTEDAIYLARQHKPGITKSDQQIGDRLRKAAAAGLIGGAHQSQSKTWWYPREALTDFLLNARWGEARTPPPTPYPTIELPNEPWGQRSTLADELENGQTIVHDQNGISYMLYFVNGRIIGQVDEEHYARIGQVPPFAPPQPLEIPQDKKETNAILKRYGYSWRKKEETWELWHIAFGGAHQRLIGTGNQAVALAFNEINTGTITKEYK